MRLSSRCVSLGASALVYMYGRVCLCECVERERERERERENKVGKAEAPFDGRLCPPLSIIIPNLLLL